MDSKALVSSHWLHAHLQNDDVRIIDASWHMPAAGRNGYEEFKQEAIEGAGFFDIDGVNDKSSDYPHMLPSPEQFADAMTALDIENYHRVIIYDAAGLFSAARLWWMLRYFGHERVSVLDGGLPKWRAEGYPTTAGKLKPLSQNPYKIENTYKNIYVSKDDVQQAIEQRTHNIYDARGVARFDGSAQEPRAGTRSGHMRSALNIPFTTLLNDDATMKPIEDLKTIFSNTDKPIITSCGSGITACILSLALSTLGRESAVYDGSWAEWGASDDTEIITS